MEFRNLLSTCFLWLNVISSILRSVEAAGWTLKHICPKKCDPKSCSKLSFCDGTIVKDRCGCCPKCSSDVWIHPKFSPVKKGGACEEVKCPKFKVCMENMQGLPLCTCPNLFICRRRNKQVCGHDGKTYKSRCHMRVTSCSTGKRIKVKHKGQCGMVATQQYSGKHVYPDGEYDIARTRKKDKKLARRKHRRDRKRKRRHRKRSNRNRNKNRNKNKQKKFNRRKRRHHRKRVSASKKVSKNARSQQNIV